MGYKKDDPCLKKAFDTERLFVLMTRDITAPLTVLEWIKMNIELQPEEKLREAFDCAMQMKRECSMFQKYKNLQGTWNKK